MLTSPEPDPNIEEVNDDEIYAAIRYLDRNPVSASEESPDTDKQNDDRAVAICVCLYFVLLGCLAFVWLFWR